MAAVPLGELVTTILHTLHNLTKFLPKIPIKTLELGAMVTLILLEGKRAVEGGFA